MDTHAFEMTTGICHGAFHLCFFQIPEGGPVWEGCVFCRRWGGGMMITFIKDGDDATKIQRLNNGLELYANENVLMKDMSGSYLLTHGTYKLKLEGVSLLEFEELGEGIFKYTGYETKDHMCCMSKWVISFANSAASQKPWFST